MQVLSDHLCHPTAESSYCVVLTLVCLNEFQGSYIPNQVVDDQEISAD